MVHLNRYMHIIVTIWVIFIINSSGHLGVWIDLGDNKPGMKLQPRERGQDWKNYVVNRKVVRSPVDLESLPAGEYAQGVCFIGWTKLYKRSIARKATLPGNDLATTN
jgi:hypothetical protein